MKLLIENWNKFVKEGTFSQDLLGLRGMEDFSREMGLPAASKAEAEITRYARLDVTELMRVASKMKARRIDSDFLIAWITGRLAAHGGPDEGKAKRLWGDHTDAMLFSKYKDTPTKYDSLSSRSNEPAQSNTEQPGGDHPADGLEPMPPKHYDTHSGGVEEPSGEESAPRVSVGAADVLPALKRLVTKDFTSPEGATAAKKILHTIIAALEKEEFGN